MGKKDWYISSAIHASETKDSVRFKPRNNKSKDKKLCDITQSTSYIVLWVPVCPWKSDIHT